jgi:hypothetical protein
LFIEFGGKAILSIIINLIDFVLFPSMIDGKVKPKMPSRPAQPKTDFSSGLALVGGDESIL